MAAYTTIDDPSAYFKVQLYTGNGSANHAITFDDTDTDMQPDLVWIKNRDATDSHCLFDAVRGATKLLPPDTNGAESTDTDTLDSFTSDGFQVDADVKVNTNTEKYVAWCWKANGTGSANTAGSINTTATSANTTSGFSIGSYGGNSTGGATVGHGLGAVPTMMVVRQTGEGGWIVYNRDMDTSSPEDFFIKFELADARTDSALKWNDTAPTSTLFSLGSGTDTNGSSRTYMAYCFTDIQGFSKCGSYEGNGNADGAFVYTGFRPAFVMTKSIDSESAWHIFDNKREGYNVDNDALEADDTTVEATADQIDLVSNGFKCRIATDPNVAETYIFMAFAEAPLVNSEGVPCNAR